MNRFDYFLDSLKHKLPSYIDFYAGVWAKMSENGPCLVMIAVMQASTGSKIEKIRILVKNVFFFEVSI